MSDASQPKTRSRYAVLCEKFLAELDHKLEAIAATVLRLDDTSPASQITSAAAAVHQLAGSCGIYGQQGLSEQLAGVEIELLAVQPQSDDTAQKLQTIAQRLQQLKPVP